MKLSFITGRGEGAYEYGIVVFTSVWRRGGFGDAYLVGMESGRSRKKTKE